MKKDNFINKRILPLVRKKAFTLIIFLIVLVAIFSIWSNIVGTKFFAKSTFRNILQSIVVSSFLTLGAGCLMISGNMDISSSSIGAFGGIVIAACCMKGWPWWVGIILGLLLCAVIGFLNGFLVSKFRFPAFITTLGMASVAKGCTYLFSALFNNGTAANLNFRSDVIKYLGSGKILGLPIGIYIMILFFIV